MHFSYIRSDPLIDFLSSFRMAEFTFLSRLFCHINLCSALTSLVSTFSHKTREIAHETSFCFCSRNEFHETSFLPLLTKWVLTKRVLTKRVFWHCSRNECSRNEFLACAHETSFTKRVFYLCSRNECSRNECSRNEFLSTAHETSAHEPNSNSWAQNTGIDMLTSYTVQFTNPRPFSKLGWFKTDF